jgi:hypothetical protein
MRRSVDYDTKCICVHKLPGEPYSRVKYVILADSSLGNYCARFVHESETLAEQSAAEVSGYIVEIMTTFPATAEVEVLRALEKQQLELVRGERYTCRSKTWDDCINESLGEVIEQVKLKGVG